MTPNTGFIKPKTAILDGGLYFKSKDQSVYATAEIQAIYNKRNIGAIPSNWNLPPINFPIMIRTVPPIINCHPLSYTGFAFVENFLINADEHAADTVEINMKNSPFQWKLISSPAPPRLTSTTPAKPIMQPRIFGPVSFSWWKMRLAMIKTRKEFAPLIIEDFTHDAWASHI